MQLTDILPLEQWIEFEKNINSRYGLTTAIFDKDGNKVTQYANWGNRLCPVIKGGEKGRSAICAVANQNMLEQAKQTKRSVVEECDAGLMKFVSPVFAGDEFLGIATGCGRLFDTGEVDSFLINKLAGIDEEEIESLSSDIDKISKEEMESIIGYVEEWINEIMSDFKK